MVLWVIIVGFVIGFALAFAIGANDVANSFGTTVGSKALTLRKACILASIFETIGAVLIGAKVSSTISKGIIDVNLYANDVALLELGYLAALFGSFVWLFVATWLKLPVSGTHSIVGSVIGFTVVAKGFSGVNWMVLVKIVASWFISPVFSGAISSLIYFFLHTTILKLPDYNSQLKRGILLLPFFYAITLAVNAFSVFNDGPNIPFLPPIPLWGAIVISILAGIVSGIMARVLIAPRVKASMASIDSSSCSVNSQSPLVKTELYGAADSKDANDESKEGDLPNPPQYTCHAAMLRISTSTEFSSLEDDPPAYDAARSHQPIYEKLSNSDSSKQNFDVEKAEAATNGTVMEYAGVFQLFTMLQILTACFGAFAHGGNDVSNAVGPLVGLWSLYNGESPDSMQEPALWILALGGVGITLGLWILGRRVIETVGTDLTPVTPPSGFSIELGAAMTVLVASQAYVPVSTTHCKIGSLVSVGILRAGRQQVDWKIFRNIILAWVVTVPASGAVSAAIMWLLQMVAYDPTAANQLLFMMTNGTINGTNETMSSLNSTVLTAL